MTHIQCINIFPTEWSHTGRIISIKLQKLARSFHSALVSLRLSFYRHLIFTRSQHQQLLMATTSLESLVFFLFFFASWKPKINLVFFLLVCFRGKKSLASGDFCVPPNETRYMELFHFSFICFQVKAKCM